MGKFTTKGYQGIKKIHQLSQTPIKKPKGKKLTKDQKKYNRQLNRLRINVEHVNRRLKIFKLLSVDIGIVTDVLA